MKDTPGKRVSQDGTALPWPPPGLAPSPSRQRRRLGPRQRPGQQPSRSPSRENAEPLPSPRRLRQQRDHGRRHGLAAEAIAGNLVFTREQVTAWYVLPLQRWSFRPPDDRAALTEALTARLSQFAGRRIYIRVTSRPYEAWQWAAAFDASTRDRQPVLRGPCPAHPHLSAPGCPSCRSGQAWLDWLAQQQARIREWGIADRVTYLGVQVAGRSGLTRMLGQAWGRAADLEVSGLASAVNEISTVVAAPGLGGVPATPAQMQWLLARSCGLHLPAPAALEDDPGPVPYALPAVAPDVMETADLAQVASAFRWSAQPFGRTVLVTRGDGLAVHVAVLTVAGMTDQEDDVDNPWIQRTDRLSFPTEWMIIADVRRREEVAREMRSLMQRIRHQNAHITLEHGQPAPLSLERQMRTARRIEDESQVGSDAFASRVRTWARIAVAGETEKEAADRARQVAELYAPGITVVHSPGQYALAREFIPGERMADFGHRRAMETGALAAGMPAASATVGHRHGFPIGVTTSTAARAVTLHPWYGMEELNHSGLITVTGTLGGGKSTLAGLFAYMAVRAGIPTVVMDPSGMLDRLCHIPEIARASLAVNLLESPAGTLNPYRLIPDPPPDTRTADREPGMRAAAVARRALVTDILRMLLPPRVQGEATEFALGEAVRAAPATLDSSPQQVIAALAGLERDSLADRGALLAGILEGVSEHPLARLFFPVGDAPPGATIGQGSLLTVMTLRGLVLPGDARRPEERTAEEQLSIPVLHLAAQLLRRLLLDLPRSTRKLAVLDEAHMVTSDATGRKVVNELARDSRKNDACVIYVSQNPADLLAAGVANLVGAAFAFRTEGGQEQAATLDLLGLPHGAGYEEHLARLSLVTGGGPGETGECLMRDGQGGIEQVQVDLGGNAALRAALNSAPGRSSAGGGSGVVGRPFRVVRR